MSKRIRNLFYLVCWNFPRMSSNRKLFSLLNPADKWNHTRFLKIFRSCWTIEIEDLHNCEDDYNVVSNWQSFDDERIYCLLNLPLTFCKGGLEIDICQEVIHLPLMHFLCALFSSPSSFFIWSGSKQKSFRSLWILKSMTQLFERFTQGHVA